MKYIKKIFFLLIIVGLIQPMEPGFKPQPNLASLPIEVLGIILDAIIKRNDVLECARFGKCLHCQDIEEVARDLKSFIFTSKRLAAVVNPNTINGIIIALATKWPNHDSHNKMADELLTMQIFEKNNKKLADQINRLILDWKGHYVHFEQSVHNADWEVAKNYLQQGFPIHDIVNGILRLRPDKESKYKLEKLIELGADSQIIQGLQSAYYDRIFRSGIVPPTG